MLKKNKSIPALPAKNNRRIMLRCLIIFDLFVINFLIFVQQLSLKVIDFYINFQILINLPILCLTKIKKKTQKTEKKKL